MNQIEFVQYGKMLRHLMDASYSLSNAMHTVPTGGDYKSLKDELRFEMGQLALEMEDYINYIAGVISEEMFEGSEVIAAYIAAGRGSENTDITHLRYLQENN